MKSRISWVLEIVTLTLVLRALTWMNGSVSSAYALLSGAAAPKHVKVRGPQVKPHVDLYSMSFVHPFYPDDTPPFVFYYAIDRTYGEPEWSEVYPLDIARDFLHMFIAFGEERNLMNWEIDESCTSLFLRMYWKWSEFIFASGISGDCLDAFVIEVDDCGMFYLPPDEGIKVSEVMIFAGDEGDAETDREFHDLLVNQVRLHSGHTAAQEVSVLPSST